MRFLFLVVFPIIFTVVGILIMGLGVYLGFNIALITLGFLVSALSLVIKINVTRIPAGNILIVDRNGNFIKKEAGYIFLFPVLDKAIREIPKDGRKWKISLFKSEDEEERRKEWFDLKGGGKIILEDPEIWISVDKPLIAIKEDENFEERVKETAESTVREFLNSRSVNSIQELSSKKIRSGIEEKLENKFDGSNVSVNFHDFTFDNFDFDESTTAIRKKMYESEARIDIEKNNAKAAAERAKIDFHEILGDFIYKVAISNNVSYEEAQEIIKDDPELQSKMDNMYKDFKQRLITDITDIRVSGTNPGEEVFGLKKNILEGMALWQALKNESKIKESNNSNKNNGNNKKKEDNEDSPIILKGSDGTRKKL
jgi:regulator of protease activity HflC (stomatin/prohibitin superfamily)